MTVVGEWWMVDGEFCKKSAAHARTIAGLPFIFQFATIVFGTFLYSS